MWTTILPPILLHWAQLFSLLTTEVLLRLEKPRSSTSLVCSSLLHIQMFATESQDLLMDRKMPAHCCSIQFPDKCISTFLPLLISIQNLLFLATFMRYEWSFSWETPFIAAVCLLPACYSSPSRNKYFTHLAIWANILCLAQYLYTHIYFFQNASEVWISCTVIYLRCTMSLLEGEAGFWWQMRERTTSRKLLKT